MTEHEINLAYERQLEEEWERFNEEKPDEDDYDDRAYDEWVDEQLMQY